MGFAESQFVYTHMSQASAYCGSLLAGRKITTPADIEVYWMTRSLKGVVWPYELHRSTTNWPVNASKYQIYVRGASNALGPDVRIPAGITATLMPFQEPVSHALPVSLGSFSTIAAGWSLLKYDAGNDVSFQVVRSVLHNDPILFPSGTNQLFSAILGGEIGEAG